MKYRLRTYRDAYIAAIEGKSEREIKDALKRLLSILVSNRDFSRVHLISKEIRRAYLKRRGIREAIVESAAPLEARHRRSIAHALGAGAHVEETVRPELLAGVRITIDDEFRIDATGKGILDELFSEKRHG